MDTKKKKLKTTNSPSVILRLENIKPNSKITLFNLAHLLKMKWIVYQGLLAEMGGVSVRTINRCLVELENSGFIKRETKLFNGGGKETKYVILWDNITQYTKETDWYDNKTADLRTSNEIDIPTPQQVEEKPAEPTKTTKKEEIEVVNNNTDNDMGTFIGDFKELNSKTTAPTAQNAEVKFDDFSNELKKLLNEYKGVIDQLTTMIAKANMSDDVSIIADAKMAEMRIKNISKQLVAEIDKTNYRGYIDENIETKTKKLQIA